MMFISAISAILLPSTQTFTQVKQIYKGGIKTNHPTIVHIKIQNNPCILLVQVAADLSFHWIKTALPETADSAGFSNIKQIKFWVALSFIYLLAQVAMCMGFYGLGSGGWFLMVPLLLAENLGVENIASSYGLVRLFQSIKNFCGPIIAGLLMDSTGTPSSSFYFMGVHMALRSVIIMMLPAAYYYL